MVAKTSALGPAADTVRDPAADAGPDAPGTAAGPGRAVSISVSGLRKTFRRRNGVLVKALDDLSLEIRQGEMLVLLGPSGCGKTTLLRSIAGLERPEAGEIVVEGSTVFSGAKRVNVPPNGRDISMMFQTYALWPHMTVAKNVAYPLKGHDLNRQQVRERVEEILERVGIGGLGTQFPGQLSGGQQQRVALARSLVTNPRVVLFDEPLSNVDAKVREELRLELMTKQKELGFTGVYVTHDQVEAMQLADRLVVLEAGRIAQIDVPRTVYTRPADKGVARFVGTLNEFGGVLTGIGPDGSLEVTCPLGRLTGHDPNGGMDGARVGDEVLVGVRAEALHVGPAGAVPRGHNACPGRVLTEGFAGSYVVRAFAVGEIVLDVHTWAGAAGVGPGGTEDGLAAHFAPSDTMVFPA